MSENSAGESDHASSSSNVQQVTDTHRDLANQALLDFDNKNYGSCLQVLGRLSGQRSTDPHVLHNKAVTEFYALDCKSTEQLRRSLHQICYMCHSTPENAKNLEDVDQACVYYNQAVVLHYLRQHHAALLIADNLFHIADSMDEELAKRVMFLLVELYICCYMPERAMGLLSYVEKSLAGNSRSSHYDDKQDEGSGDPSEDSLSALWKCRISQYKMRCYLMMKSLKFCKREMKSLTNTSNPCSTMLFGYLKSHFEYLRGNYRKAMKILLAAPQSPTVTESGSCLSVMYLNDLSCIHFAIGKPNLATFYLRKALTENERVMLEVCGGDQNDKTSLSGRPMVTIGMSCYHSLVHNLGVQLLHCGRPLPAFDCLLQAVQLFHTNPRIWLRLAECCIMTNHVNNKKDSSLERRMTVIQGVLGSGLHRKLLLGSSNITSPNISQSPAMPTATLEFASLCLQNALLLLPDPASKSDRNTDDETPFQGGPLPPESNLVRAAPSNPLRPNEVANLRASILCCSAYVSLNLHDHIAALAYCQQLLSQPQLSSAHKYLAHMYMGEALATADRLADAMDHFVPQSVIDVSVTPPPSKTDSEKLETKGEKSDRDGGVTSESLTESETGAYITWYPTDVTKARALMQFNLAVAHAMRGHYHKARMSLGESVKVIGSPLPVQMYSLRLYLDLIEGHRNMAQLIIKDHFGHVTMNRVDPASAGLDSSSIARY